jgi:transposase
VKNLWHHVLGLSEYGRRVVVESVDFDPDVEEIVASVRLRRNAKRRCGVCERRSPGYDRGRATARRRWRSVDMGTVQVFLEAEPVRVRCRDHGIVAAEVPWARHGSRFTRGFEDTIGWLATATSKTAVTELMRVGWRTVGGIVEHSMGVGALKTGRDLCVCVGGWAHVGGLMSATGVVHVGLVGLIWWSVGC